MGIMNKFSKALAPTSTDPVIDDRPGTFRSGTEKPNIEKSEHSEGEERGISSDLEVGHPPVHSHDPAAEREVVRKMDWRIPPLVAALYLLSFLDRSNIGNAKIAGMSKDLDLVGNRYQWLLNIFYISYIVFEFLCMMWKIVPPHIWAAFVVFGWGLVAACQAATVTWAGEMACRFFLGAFEAGFGPGIPYLLSFFYLRHEVGLRIGFFLSAAPFATMFSGALAYGITSGHSKLANWRLLFLVEGLPTMVMAVIVFFYLPDAPEKAKFLTAEEKLIAKARGVRQVGKTERIGHIVWSDVVAALMDPKNWLTALMYFSCNVSFSSLPVFLPTILNDMGFSSIDAQGLTAPPYFVAFLLTIFSTYVADRTQQRGLTIFVLSCIGGIGYILLAATESVGARYFGVFLAAMGVFPCIANILPWVLNNQGSDTRRGIGIVMLNTIGQCGPLLGTNVFPESESPRYVKGQAICAAFIFFNGFLALALRALLVRENRKLDAKYAQEMGTPEAREKESHVGEENYGANFRYIL
ncbi:hypothetical protein MMC25_003767 [Agyrium rufum]|nr:hypothetical protein [Agyrium rufum]